MPRRNKKGKKGGNRGNKSGGVSRIGLLGGFNDRERVTLRYAESFSISTATVAASSYVFSGNGIFDPNVTSTGSQPANFDDFSAIYLRYRVFGSKIVVKHANEIDAADDGVRLIVAPRHTATDIITVPTALDALSQPYAKFVVVKYYTTGTPDGTIRSNMTTSKIMGLSDLEFKGRDDLTALVSAQPSHQWYWHINQSNVNTANTCVTFFTVTIDYDVEFWDRVDTTLDLDSKIAHLTSLRDAKSKRTQENKIATRYASIDRLEAKFATRNDGIPKVELKMRAPEQYEEYLEWFNVMNKTPYLERPLWVQKLPLFGNEDTKNEDFVLVRRKPGENGRLT